MASGLPFSIPVPLRFRFLFTESSWSVLVGTFVARSRSINITPSTSSFQSIFGGRRSPCRTPNRAISPSNRITSISKFLTPSTLSTLSPPSLGESVLVTIYRPSENVHLGLVQGCLGESRISNKQNSHANQQWLRDPGQSCYAPVCSDILRKASAYNFFHC